MLVLTLSAPAAVWAQEGAIAPPDATERLREVLPPDAAARVLARVRAAREAGLPAAALEQRALKFAARGIPAPAIERALAEQVERLTASRRILRAAGRTADAEVEAGAEALRQGVNGEDVRALATSAPSGRSLVVPLHVAGALAARGLPSDQAIARVRERLLARASDVELERLPTELPSQARPALPEQARGRAIGRGNGGGPPAGVPANGGSARRPATGKPPSGGSPPGAKPPGRP